MKTPASARRPGKALATAPSATPPAVPSAISDPEPEFGFAPPDHYDPADYRWVPVRRRPRRDGWTEEKQRRFIEVLADTGLVSLAAKEVGMTRMSAYRLRRAPYAGAFARAWDIARERAGALIEDIAFERAIEGVEQELYDEHGELKGSRTIHNDRILTFLLRHLRPEIYSAAARERRGGAWPNRETAQGDTLDAALRAMEPAPPGPVETLVDPGELEDGLLCAEIADGVLPSFHAEQAPAKSPEQARHAENAVRYERGREACARMDRGETLSDAEFADLSLYLDPAQAMEKRRKRRGEKPV